MAVAEPASGPGSRVVTVLPSSTLRLLLSDLSSARMDGVYNRSRSDRWSRGIVLFGTGLAAGGRCSVIGSGCLSRSGGATPLSRASADKSGFAGSARRRAGFCCVGFGGAVFGVPENKRSVSARTRLSASESSDREAPLRLSFVTSFIYARDFPTGTKTTGRDPISLRQAKQSWKTKG